MALLLCGNMIYAQSVGLEYVSELQTNFNGDNNFVNLLKLNGELPLSDKVRFRLSTISVARTNDEDIVNDLQVFSNIDVENIPFALSVAAVEWDIDAHNSLLFGVHNMNEDTFSSDVTGLFTIVHVAFILHCHVIIR